MSPVRKSWYEQTIRNRWKSADTVNFPKLMVKVENNTLYIKGYLDATDATDPVFSWLSESIKNLLHFSSPYVLFTGITDAGAAVPLKLETATGNFIAPVNYSGMQLYIPTVAISDNA